MSHDVYRDGRVYVCREMCSTCVFRPGNLMQLQPGRVREMVDEARAADSAIVCHKTLDGPNAVCRGFADRWPTLPLKLAAATGVIVEVDPDREGG